MNTDTWPGDLPPGQAAHVGRTVHVARGARYDGAYIVTAVVPHDTEPGWFHLRQGRLQSPAVQDHHVFATEDEARAAARSRRAPRRPRRAVPSTGDWAFVAALNGLNSDGTPRRAV